MEDLAATIDPHSGYEVRRRRLYERGLEEYAHVPKLLMELMQEFTNEKNVLPDEIWFSGRGPDEETRTGLPPWIYHEEDALESPPLDEIRRIEVKGGQTLLV
jgi:hypothetical protein